jgi:hypothetical protein
MMAAILCGLGAVEAMRWLAEALARRWSRAAAIAALALAGLGWTSLAIANAAALTSNGPWRGLSLLLEMATDMSQMPAICGIGFGNLIPYGTGGYTFLHRPIPIYHSVGPDQRDFIRLRPGYNAFVTRRDDMPFFEGLGAFEEYKLDHCNDLVCLFIRPGTCTAMPSPRLPIGTLSAATTLDPRYPYAVGIGH